MKVGRFVLTSVARGIGTGLKHAAASRRELGSCGVTLITSPLSSGMTTAINQAAEIHGYLVADIHADPTVRTVMNAVHRAVFGDESLMYGSDQTFGRVVREMRDLGGPCVVHNADRLTAKTLDLFLDLGDSTGLHIVLCGSQRLRRLITSAPSGSLLERIKTRIVFDVELPGPSLADARLLAEELAEVKFDADLIEHVFKQSGTSVRSLLVKFEAIEETAAVANLERIGLARWLALSGESEQPKLTAPRKAIAAPRSEIASNTAFKGAVKVA